MRGDKLPASHGHNEVHQTGSFLSNKEMSLSQDLEVISL